MTDQKPIAGLELLRVPFPANQISKLPKPTKHQTDAVKADFKEGIRCQVCGGWHHPKVVHLDYVGHAALTDRLLDCDPEWNWEPVALALNGTPELDSDGGMWIRLTVCGVTRLGYGFPDGKTGGNAMKETIGDAMRNAAIRFGAALDLWHKGDLHVAADDKPEDESQDNPFDDPPKDFTDPENPGLTIGVKGAMVPKDATGEERAAIFELKIIEEFGKVKTFKGNLGVWTRNQRVLDRLKADYPDNYANILAAFDARQKEIEEGDE